MRRIKPTAGAEEESDDVLEKTKLLCQTLIREANIFFDDSLSSDFSVPHIKKKFKAPKLPVDKNGNMTFPCAQVWQNANPNPNPNPYLNSNRNPNPTPQIGMNPRTLCDPMEAALLVKFDREMCMDELRLVS